MFLTMVMTLLWTGLVANGETHSLVHIYLAISKPVDLQAIHEFTAMGLLDGRMIHYYCNKEQKTLPKQDWMKEGPNLEYGEKCTQPLYNQQRLMNIIHTLINQKKQSNSDIHDLHSDIHDLQWMRGCVGEVQSNGLMEFVRGMDVYNYDGDHLLSFHSTNQDTDTSDKDGANKITQSLDVFPKEVTVSYLKNQCIETLSKFLKYANKQLLEAPKPDVFLFAKKVKQETNVVLTCLATGFYPKDIILHIRKDGRILTKKDDLKTSGVRPNEDDTFQRRDHVEILMSDMSEYTCEVIHKASNLSVDTKWDHSYSDDGGKGVIIGAVFGAFVGVGVGVWIAVVMLISSMCKAQENRGSGSLLLQTSAVSEPCKPWWSCSKVSEHNDLTMCRQIFAYKIRDTDELDHL